MVALTMFTISMTTAMTFNVIPANSVTTTLALFSPTPMPTATYRISPTQAFLSSVALNTWTKHVLLLTVSTLKAPKTLFMTTKDVPPSHNQKYLVPAFQFPITMTSPPANQPVSRVVATVLHHRRLMLVTPVTSLLIQIIIQLVLEMTHVSMIRKRAIFNFAPSQTQNVWPRCLSTGNFVACNNSESCADVKTRLVFKIIQNNSFEWLILLTHSG